MQRKLRRAIIAATLLVCTASGPTLVLAANESAPGPAPGEAGPPARAGKTADARTAAQRVEQRITDMHKHLRITAAQQPQWEAFASAMRDNARQMDAVLAAGAAKPPALNAVEQMQSYAAITDRHAKGVAGLVPPFRDLYDVMSPEQKRDADTYFRSQPKRGGHAQTK